MLSGKATMYLLLKAVKDTAVIEILKKQLLINSI